MQFETLLVARVPRTSCSKCGVRAIDITWAGTHDWFHIAKHLGEAVDRVRRAEHKDLKRQGDDRLTGSRYLWLTREENLSDKRAATFAELREANLKTSRAWALRELFREFWEQPGEFTGRLFFGEWYAWASRCRLRPMVKTAKRLKRHLERLVTWFDHPTHETRFGKDDGPVIAARVTCQTQFLG